MSVTSTAVSVTYAGDDFTLDWPVSFKFMDASDLVVTSTFSGVTTTLTLGVDYTVSGGSDGTGTVHTATTVGPTRVFVITRKTAPTQPTSFQAQGAFLPVSHELALDRLTMVAQEQAAAISTNTASLVTLNGEISGLQTAVAAIGTGGGGGGGGGGGSGAAVQTVASVAALPSHTYTPVLAAGTVLVITMDAAPTLSNPNVASVPAGTEVVVILKQDSVGGWVPTWGANFKGVGSIIPKPGATMESEFVFELEGSGNLTLISHTGSDLNRPLNPRHWGALADGSTDDQPAVQACLDYAQQLRQTIGGVNRYTAVDFGEGIFMLGKPLVIAHVGSIEMYGTDRAQCFFRGPNFRAGPDVIIAPASVYSTRPVPLSINNLPGLGNSMSFYDSNVQPSYPNEYRISTSQIGFQQCLDGLAQMCVEVDFKITAAATATGSDLVWSLGSKCQEDTVDTAFRFLLINNTRVLNCKMNVGGTVYTLSTSALSIGTWYHVAMSYDGATIRLFVNGSMVTSQAATGTIVQRWWEEIGAGPSANIYPMGDVVGTNGVNCLMDFFRVSSTARYTSNFTALTAKPAPDNNAVFHTSFELATGLGAYASGNMVWKHYYTIPGEIGGITPCYVLARNANQLGGFLEFKLHDINLGNGLEAYCTQSSAVWGISCGTGRGIPICFSNNDFTNSVRDVSLSPISRCYAAILNIGASGINRFENINVTGQVVPFVSQDSSVVVEQGYWNGCRPAFVGQNGSSDGCDAVFKFVAMTDEGGNTAAELLVLRNASFVGEECTIEKTGSSDTGAPVVFSGPDNRTTWRDSWFNVKTSIDGVFKAKTAQNQPVIMENRKRWRFIGADPSRPLNTTPTLMQVVDVGLGIVQPWQVSDTDYTATGREQVIAYTGSLTAGRAVTLPVGAVPPTGSFLDPGQRICVKDETGQAASHNITIQVTGGGNIDGGTSAVINTNWGIWRGRWNGSRWVSE